jgi:hypothetical protein
MIATFRKKLLVNLTWAGIFVAGSVIAYVASFGGVQWLLGRGSMGEDFAQRLENTVYFPLVSWGGPGAETLIVFSDWCYWQGTGEPKSWQEVTVDYQEWMKRFEPGGAEYAPQR